MPEKAFHLLISQNLQANPAKFLRFYKDKPDDAQFKLATRVVSELIEDFKLTVLKLDEMDNYSRKHGLDEVGKILLCMAFIDFYLETTSPGNRKAIAEELVYRRQILASNILTYLTTEMGGYIDHNKLFQWALDMQSPPSVRPKHRNSSSHMKSAVQPVRSGSTTPSAS